MADGMSYQIDIGVRGAGQIDDAATKLATMTSRLSQTGSAAEQAADAMRIAEVSITKSKSAAEKAASALEKIGAAAAAQRGKVEAALAIGDLSAAETAAEKLDALLRKQSQAKERADAAQSALDAEAASLARLRTAATDAAAAHGEVQRAIDAQKASTDRLATTDVSGGAAEIGKVVDVLGTAVTLSDEAAASFRKASESLDPERYGSAATAIANLEATLIAAKDAASQAEAAVREGESAYRLAESAANRAAQAVEKIGIAADAERGKLKAALDVGDQSAAERAAASLRKLTDRQGEALKLAHSAAIAMNTEAVSLDRLKNAATAAQGAQSKVAASLDQAKKAAIDAKKSQDAMAGSGKVNEIAEGLGKLGGPLGRIGSQAFGTVDAMKKLGGSLGSTTGLLVGASVGAIAVAVAIAAVAAAALAGVVAIGRWAIGLADAARTQSLLMAGIARSVKGGAELQATIDNLATRVPLTSDELQSMASSLANTGLRGKDLANALETAAIKAATLKFGPDFEKQMLSLDFQAARLKAGIAGIFGGLKIEGLLKGLSRIVDLFSETDAAGQAIKVVFESIFQPLIDGVTAFIPKMIGAFIQFEILVLKALIAIKPFGSKIVLVAQIFGVMALAVAGAAAIVIGVLVAIGMASAALVAGILYLGFLFTRLAIAIVTEPGAALEWLKNKFLEAVAFVKSIDLAQIGTDMIMGLVAGITGAAGQVVGAISNAVTGAIAAAKNLLDSHSPSRVFATIGESTGEGMTAGIEDSAAGVQGALETMVAPPDVPKSALERMPAPTDGRVSETGGAAPQESGSSSSGGVNLAGATFHFHGVKDAENVRTTLLRFFEGMAIQIGGAVPDA